MKNTINYYYNLYPEKIILKNKKYSFKIDKYYYEFKELEINNIEEIYRLSLEIYNKGIYVNQIIPNIENNIVTSVNGIKYILMKSFNNLNKRINENDIYNFLTTMENIPSNNEYIAWYDLWTNKMDYFEYQISEKGKKYPLLKESFSYFLGIVETGISFIVNENIRPKYLSICHDRIKYNDSLYELYNPLKYIVDVKIRDVAEYYKSLDISDETYYRIKGFINNNKLSIEEIKILFLRMLYPSFYFDKFEKIINNKEDEEEIKKSINMIDKYEKLLKKLYLFIKPITNIQEIEWFR